MPSPLLATGLIAFASLCFGMVPLFARALLADGLSAEAIALYRFCLALPLALAFLPWRRGTLRPVIALAGAGLAGGLGWTSYLNAIDTVPIASAGVFYMSYPLFVVILGRFLVGQDITPRAIGGAVLVLGGAFIVNAPGTVSAEQFLVLLSTLPAPIGFALIVVLIATAGRDLSVMERWSAVCVGHVAGLLPAALLSGSGTLFPATAEGWAWIGGIALVTATLPQILYTFAARSVSVSRASAAGAAELPTMMAIGLIAFGEPLGLNEAFGALLVVAAILVTPAVTATPATIPRFLSGATEGRS